MILAMLVYAAIFVIIYFGFSRLNGVVWANYLADAPPVLVAQIKAGAQSTVILIFGILLPFWVVGSLFITQQFSKPIDEIRESAQQVEELNDYVEEVDLEEASSVFSSTDEIVQLKGMVSSMMTTIRANDEQFRSVVSNQRELIFRWKPDFGLTFVNQAFCDFFDRNEAFLLQTSGEFLRNDMVNLYPELAQIIDSEIMVTLETESESINETFLTMPNGETHWVQWRTMALYDDGNIRECQTIGNVLTELKRAQLKLEEANYQLAMLTQELIKSQEEERINVARYLHDQVLGELGEMARDSDHSLDQETMNQVIDKLRNTIYMMRSPMLNYGLSMALEDLADHLREQASQVEGMEFRFEVSKSLSRFDRQVETQIYRIVQEASKNAFEHARASVIRISGEIKDDSIDLVIADNGAGFQLSRNKDGALVSSRHYGMVGMEERCKIIGAQFEIQSEFGSGTAVQVKWAPDMIPSAKDEGATHPIQLPEI